MAYQQLIAKKIKLNGLAGIQHHMLDRDKVKTNPDIDLSRSHLNYFIENLTAEHLNSRVKSRIKQLNLKKRPRSDAVGLEDIVVKASADFMLNADAETRENYFSDALHFLQHRYGKENVMYCHCHLDNLLPTFTLALFPSLPTIVFPLNLYFLRKLSNNYKLIFIALFLNITVLNAVNLTLKNIFPFKNSKHSNPNPEPSSLAKIYRPPTLTLKKFDKLPNPRITLLQEFFLLPKIKNMSKCPLRIFFFSNISPNKV